jgi:membrane protease YdiL (CAAX protease family)
MLIAAGIATAVALRTAVGSPDPSSSDAAGIVFVVSLLALAAFAGVRPRLPAPGALAIGLVGGAVLVACSLIGRPVVALHPYAALPQLVTWTPLVTLIAIGEEALLRGALFSAAQVRWGTAAALAVSTLTFAAMHLPLYGLAAMPLDLAVGLWLGGLRVLTGGFAAPAAAHAAADLASGWLG